MSPKHSPERYVMLVEVTLTKPWSSPAVEQYLAEVAPELAPVVYGPIDGVDGAYRKLRQLARETEQGDSLGNRVHSAHKALSFFRDMFPDSFWKWKLIGEKHPGRRLAGR